MANTAVQLAANTEVNEVSERMSHCTTVSFTLAPEPPSLPPPTPDWDLLLRKVPSAHLAQPDPLHGECSDPGGATRGTVEPMPPLTLLNKCVNLDLLSRSCE